MKDLLARTEELLAAFRAEGYCTDCWVDLSDEPHDLKCSLTEGDTTNE